MNSFKGLLIKDLKITRYWFYSVLFLLLIVIAGGYGLSLYYNSMFGFFIFMMVILGAHVLYISIFLLSSLSIESRTHLWLHNPNGTTKLLLSKITTGSLYLLVSFCLTLIITFISAYVVIPSDLIDKTGVLAIVKLIYVMAVGVSLGSIYLGVWTLFYWTTYQSLRSNPRTKSTRWPILVVLFIGLSTISNLIRNSDIYKSVAALGVIKIKAFNLFALEKVNNQLQFSSTSHEIAYKQIAELSIVVALIYITIALFIFYAAAWLLDRKVEV